ARHGFIPDGERFMEAGIDHQPMHRKLAGASVIEHREAAVAIVTAIITQARRGLCIYTRELDPGLFDAPDIVDALRRFGTAGRGNEVRVVLQDAATPQRTLAPVIALAQRLPSIFTFREVIDPVDRAYASAFVVNDDGGYYFRTLGHRFDGESALDAPGRARQLREGFDRVWERSRPVTEYRALGL
ncbi:MAG: GNAT family N-acetyltransferase, partial [Pseudomonadota bacterium]|nr:GNAT family N-acetyltransferase [Pseudomonadota bacterium]